MEKETSKQSTMKEITLTNSVVISDPSHPLLDYRFEPIVLDNLLAGKYVVSVKYKNMDNGDILISELSAVHTDHQNTNFFWEGQGANIAVDSGWAGIFTSDSYRKKNQTESWYNDICELAQSKEQWGVYENGVVSKSGFGVGEYEVLFAEDGENIFGILIQFIGHY
jgi:hypothetical protein